MKLHSNVDYNLQENPALQHYASSPRLLYKQAYLFLNGVKLTIHVHSMKWMDSQNIKLNRKRMAILQSTIHYAKDISLQLRCQIMQHHPINGVGIYVVDSPEQ